MSEMQSEKQNGKQTEKQSENALLRELLALDEQLSGEEAFTQLLADADAEQSEAQSPMQPKAPEYFLLDMAENRLTRIDHSPFSVGSGSGCDLVIVQDADYRPVSRMHCEIRLRPEGVFLRDLSKNGTYLGEAGMPDEDFFRLPYNTEVRLPQGCIVRFTQPRFMLIVRS